MRPDAVRLLAPAKINLTLHVTGRRADGRHLLDSIVVFAAVGDDVELRRAPVTTLAVSGPFAGAVPAGQDNLALRAARLAGTGVAIALRKELPVGAGIGGGSSDAGAVLRGIAALTGMAPGTPGALELGADVPVCLAARPARMRGIGERLDPLPPLPDLPLVLVNPGVPVSTAAVFAALERRDGAPMPEALPCWADARAAAAWLGRMRNDLEPPAMRLAPAIAEAATALATAPGCLLARMSGSGGTVFGLFPSPDEAARAAAAIAARRPDWWVRATRALAAAPEISAA